MSSPQPPPIEADPLGLVGTTIVEKYAVESVVGEGGFAVVYKAQHLIWKRPVAIKVFKVLSDVKKEERERLLEDFIQEGALLAELSERSASICQARDVGTLSTAKGDWLPYMVLEWLEGASLEAVLADEKQRAILPRSLEQTIILIEPAAEALALAHKQGIAHRDIKPANIFLLAGSKGEGCPVKLLDFGIAKVVSDAQKLGGAFTKTSGQVTSFTPAYGAPEQFSRTHGSTGPWTDVFALALVVGECISGKSPLEGDDYMQIAYAAADKERRPTPRALGATVSDEVEAVFARALAVAPADRYKTAGKFWNALRAAIGWEPMKQLGLASVGAIPVAPDRSSEIDLGQVKAVTAHNTTTSPASLIPTVPPKPKSRAPFFALVAVVALGLGAAAYFGLHKPVAPIASSSTVAKGLAAPAASTAVAFAAAPPTTCPSGMVYVEGGRFYMGSDDDLPQEKPAHNVTLSPYCIDVFEVTTERYKTCSDIGRCKRAAQTNEWSGITPTDRRVYDPLCNMRDPSGKAKHPVNCVDWKMAFTFCKEYGGRLPTEAEWEFAARGPDGRKYPWGDDAPTGGHLNACGPECVAWGKKNHVELTAMYGADDGWPNTAPVGSFPGGKSRYGVEDVVGNVWEWVADWNAPYDAEDQTDPHGPALGTERVIRGGAWNGAIPAWVRPTFRYKDEPTKRSHGIGFRCARSL